MAIRARLTAPRVTRKDWPWHEVKSTSLSASIVFRGERRMEAENFLSPGFSIRHAFQAKGSGWTNFAEIAKVWQPSRLKGVIVAPEFGTGYLSATQVYDTKPIPRRFLSEEKTTDLEARFVKDETILITRSGSVGRATVAGRSLNGHMVSDDLLRVTPKEKDDWGWTYAYLRSPTARALMTSAQYGHIIKHLEVSHLEAMPIMTVTSDVKARFNKHLKKIQNARSKAHELIVNAEAEFEKEIGISEPIERESIGFTTDGAALFSSGRRFEGYYHNPVAREADRMIRNSGHKIERLVDLVERVFIPGRFKHIYGENGFPYLDSAQILEIAPDIKKYVLSLNEKKRAQYLVDAGAILLPCSGQLHGIIGSVVLAGIWHENKILTNHILRIIPKAKPDVRVGYLHMVLSHPKLGRPRVLRGAFGSSVPELSVLDVEELSVPRMSSDKEDSIANAIEEAASLTAQANLMEEKISLEAEAIINKYLL